ncbi:MAG TPA: methyl-accepting chemotaxis protein [Planctomycetota bacterium]|nr:methyl-accepting chemotaxis protein [Planctomycetota bacterium]
MLKSISSKLIGSISLLLLCMTVLGAVALWGMSRQGTLLRDAASEMQAVMDRTASLSAKLKEADNNANRMGERAVQLGEHFRAVQQLVSVAGSSAQEARRENLAALAGTTLRWLDRQLDSARFLTDTIVKERHVRENAVAFYQAAMDDLVLTPTMTLPEGVDPYEGHWIVRDSIDALASSLLADFYVAVGVDGEIRGKGFCSNDERLVPTDLSASVLYQGAMRQYRLTKSMDRLAGDLVLGAATFLKSDAGKDVAILVAGYRLDGSTLRFLSDDLRARLVLFLADDSENVAEARHSTLVDAEGRLVTGISVPPDIAARFHRRLLEARKSGGKGSEIDSQTIRKDLLEVREVEVGGLSYIIGYQALLSDDAKLLGILGIARDTTLAILQQDEIHTKASEAIQSVDGIDASRREIALESQRGRQEAEVIVQGADNAKTKLSRLLDTVKDFTWTARASTAGALAVALILGVVISVLGHRTITRPIRKSVWTIQDVAAGEGDLTKRLQVAGSEEIEEWARAFNSFMEKLQGIIASVGETTQSLSRSARGLKDTSQSMSDNAGQTSSQASVVSSAAEQISRSIQAAAVGMEEMSATARGVARNADHAAKVGAGAVALAGATNKIVSRLGDRGAEIGHVINVIGKIAEQTNLLALNAGIEAARAGTAGKGFTVVANEVKELAKETKRSSAEIADRIKGIQEDTTNAVNAIAQITTVIKEINQIQVSIASAVEEQSSTTGETSRSIAEAAHGSARIAEGITSVATVAQDTSNGAGSTKRAASELEKMSATLQTIVGQFKY